MKTTFDFGETKKPYERDTPNVVDRKSALIYAGGSGFGSHSVSVARTCPRAWGILNNDRDMILSDGSDTARVFPDPISSTIHLGPFSEQARESHGYKSIWMARGTLIHVALAHAMAKLAGKTDGSVIVCGHHLDSAGINLLYSPEDAIECAAMLVGPLANTYALPAARRMLPQVLEWAEALNRRERVVAIETQVVWNVPNSKWAYTARLDLATQHRQSKLTWFRDYKTAREVNATVVRSYRDSGQFAGQRRIGERLLGTSFGGVIVALLEDVGEGVDRVGIVQEHQIAAMHSSSGLAGSVATSVSCVEPHHGGPLTGYPMNPFACSSCSVRSICQGL